MYTTVQSCTRHFCNELFAENALPEIRISPYAPIPVHIQGSLVNRLFRTCVEKRADEKGVALMLDVQRFKG